jgi:hypothetical protein
MVNYPNEFPAEALGLVLAKVKGQAVDTAKLAHAGWNVLGFALAKSLGGPISQPGPDDQGTLSDEAILEAAIHSPEEGALGGVVPWALVVQIVLKILLTV